MTKHKIDPVQFTKLKRGPAALCDVEDALRQVMSHPAKPEKKSENREPTQAELQKRWKLGRSE